MGTKTHLLVIDGQIDFCDLPGSALPVIGATADMHRLAKFIRKNRSKIDDISATLDQHQTLHIAHAVCWVNSQGKNPGPFTIITASDVRQGVWRTAVPGMQDWARNYVEKLEAKRRYPLCIWPGHCLIGGPGAAVEPVLFEALQEWAIKEMGIINWVAKGSNYRAEHYSAVKAEVEDPEDPGTQINTPLIQVLNDSDIVLLAGEALSHCVANTVRDIAAEFGDANISKLHLLRDCTSPVGDQPGSTMFRDMADDFLREMTAKGMKIVTTDTFWA